MQNVSADTREFPSWASIAAGLLTIIAAVVLLLFFSIQLSHQGVSKSSTPVVTKSAGSQQVQHSASERAADPAPEPDRGALVRGPR